MHLKSFLKWSLLLVAVLVYKNSTAFELPDGVFRDHYHQTSRLPDHFAYLNLMEQINSTVEQNNRQGAINTIEDHMSFDHDQSDQFLSYLMNSYIGFQSSNRSLTDRMLCHGKLLENEDKVYRLLDTLDDIKETNLKKYYKHALITLGEQSATDLDIWLADVKSQSKHVRYSHRNVYAQMDIDVDTVISVACNQLATYYR